MAVRWRVEVRLLKILRAGGVSVGSGGKREGVISEW